VLPHDTDDKYFVGEKDGNTKQNNFFAFFLLLHVTGALGGILRELKENVAWQRFNARLI